MTLKAFFLLLFAPMVLFPSWPAMAGVEIAGKRTVALEGGVVDAAATPSGKRIFVLTDRGEILVYSEGGKLEGRLSVGPSITGIRLGPDQDSLILLKSKENAFELVDLDFIQEIDIAGAPYKGPVDAPVVIVVFSDFQ